MTLSENELSVPAWQVWIGFNWAPVAYRFLHNSYNNFVSKQEKYAC